MQHAIDVDVTAKYMGSPPRKHAAQDDKACGCSGKEHNHGERWTPKMHAPSQTASGFGRPWFALTVAFALHVLDEATTGFLAVYNPTVTAMRARFAWFPMPTFGFHEWLVGLIAGVVLCFALTPLAAQGVRWLRPRAWFYALIMFFNGTGHTVFTVTFSRPAPGFYSSPFLFFGSVGLIVRLGKTASTARLSAAAV
jgi:hypothetical protein